MVVVEDQGGSGGRPGGGGGTIYSDVIFNLCIIFFLIFSNSLEGRRDTEMKEKKLIGNEFN